MGKLPLHYVDLRTFCYATEDEPRVEAALRRYLPDDYPIDRETSEGHHGDPIVVLSARVDNADDVRHVVGKVRELDDLESVLSELERRVDEDCAFYLKLDKQAAFRGEVRRGQGILLRAKVEAYPAKRSAAVENARQALAG